MKLRKFDWLLLSWLALAGVLNLIQPQTSTAQQVDNESIIIQTEPPITPENVRQRVEQALQKVRQDDYSSINVLVQYAELTLPVLLPHAASEDDDVLHVVVSVAAVIHTPQAVEVLAKIAAEQGGSATEAIDKLYERK